MIEIIPKQRGAQILHVHPDLVGAPCLQMKRGQRHMAACFQHFVVCDCPFSSFKIRTPLNGSTLLSGNGSVYGPLRRREDTVAECQISPVDLPLFHLRGQYGGAQSIFSHDQ